MFRGYRITCVLILVLMEDALVLQGSGLPVRRQDSLNPCFNGRCTRTLPRKATITAISCSLNPCFNGRCTRTDYIKQSENYWVEES